MGSRSAVHRVDDSELSVSVLRRPQNFVASSYLKRDMGRKPPKPNPEATVCKYVAKYGLAAHMIYNADGTVAEVKISKPGAIEVQYSGIDYDREISERLAAM